uniref:Lysosomal-associated transmembrane protein 4B n=1 Tax=Ditylenchus dipsaci TaxID=166011 RepID=A0A915EUB5_9BILA
MRIMNGRLHNFVRSPLMRNSYDSNNGNNNYQQQGPPPHNGSHRHHHHHHHNNSNTDVLRRRSSENLPKSVQFDESSDSYRCLCGCFHVKTGALCIAVIELLLIFCFFLNALLVLLQQKNAYGHDRTGSNDVGGSDYVQVAFVITSVALAVSLSSVLIMIVGLTRNLASFLIPHIFVQACSIACFAALLLAGCIAVSTDNAFFYRLLNAVPFNDYPGQSTVAFPIDLTVRVYGVLFLYFVSLLLECWFIVIIYNCNRYFTERRTYMNYCLAYSTPMKTLNSAR